MNGRYTPKCGRKAEYDGCDVSGHLERSVLGSPKAQVGLSALATGRASAGAAWLWAIRRMLRDTGRRSARTPRSRAPAPRSRPSSQRRRSR
jgi:hypothetical protein